MKARSDETPAQKQLKAEIRKAQNSRLERKFDNIWLAIGGPLLSKEYYFHPTRRWRFDRAHVSLKVAIEVEGGTYSGGRHTTGLGYWSDCEKYNNATMMGWRVFRLTSDMLDIKHAQEILDWIYGKQNIVERFNAKNSKPQQLNLRNE